MRRQPKFDKCVSLWPNPRLPVGRIPKRSNGAGCKPAGLAFTGSNPVPTTIFLEEKGNSPILRTVPAQKTVKFPQTIKYRGLTAKIYAKSARDRSYRTSWSAGGKRVQHSFKKLSDAKAAALTALKQIARGQADAAALSPVEVRDLRLAQNALRELDVPLLDAVAEYVSAKKLLPAIPLGTAAKAWRENMSEVKAVPVEQVAREYLADRKGKIGPRTHHEEELRLNRICRALQTDMSGLSKSALELFFSDELGDLRGKSRNHYRQTFRQLFKFAVRRDYLPQKHRLNEVLVNEPSGEAAPEIITPKQFKTLLAAASPEMLPYIALAGFTGARRSEILRMTSKDVWRVAGHIELEAKKTKTKQRRLVPVQPALAEWLKPYKRKRGAVWSGTSNTFNHAFERLMSACDIKGQNLLRHSYASYRLAQTQEPSKVAFEMGNSPEKLFSNYNKLVTPQQADAWFAITPTEEAKNIIAV